MARLIRWQATIVDDAGNILPSATVTVNNAGGGAASTYQDANGVTPAPNPLTADASGFVSFYVAAGLYDVNATSGSNTIDWTDVELAGYQSDQVAFDPTGSGMTSTDVEAAIKEANATAAAALPTTGGTLTGELVLDEVREIVYAMPDAVVNADNGSWQTRTLAGNEALSFSLAAGQAVFVTVIPGAFVLTLTAVNEWVGGAAPATIEAEHAFVFWSDDGVTITGQSIGGIS